MTLSPISRKFNQFILNPDLANKFLHSSIQNIIPANRFTVYLKYIFSVPQSYNYIAIKAFLMVSSIYPKRCQGISRLIILKYTKTRRHSIVFLTISLQDFITFAPLLFKNPININTAINGHIKEAKHFVFPGFIKHLRLPSWERSVNISFQS